MPETVVPETRRSIRPLEVSIAIGLLIAVGLGILDFPFARIPLALGFVAYLFVLHHRPNSWPLLLLVLLPLLDLSPWAGERLFHAFDFFILAMISAIRVRIRIPARRSTLILACHPVWPQYAADGH